MKKTSTDSVKRLLQARFELGEMDEFSRVDWAQTPYSVVGSDKHDSLSLDMARKSMTLLQTKTASFPSNAAGKSSP